MKQRIVVWGAVATLVVVAAGLAVVAAGGDGDDEAGTPPRLPLDLAGSGGGAPAGAEPAADALSVDLVPVTYVAADDLPDMGGEGPAFRVPVTADRVAALAGALGIDGEPVEADGSWSAEGAGLVLSVYGPGGTWSVGPAAASGPDSPVSSPAGGGTGGGSSGNPGTPETTVAPDPPDTTDAPGEPQPTPGQPATTTTIVCVQAPCEPAESAAPAEAVGPGAQEKVAPPVAPEPVQECPADPGGASCAPACEPGPAVTCPAPGAVPPDTATTVPAGDVPPESAARELTDQVLTAAGFAPGDAVVDTASGAGTWTVSFEPQVEGAPAPGLAGALTLGAGGVVSGSGYFAPGDPLGDYPLLTTRQAIERLNAPGDVSALGAAEAGDAGEADAAAEAGDDAIASAPGSAPTSGTSLPPPDMTLPGDPAERQAAEAAAAGQEPSGGPDTPAAGPTDVPHPTLVTTAPEPAPAPEAQEVVLTGVEVVYTTVMAWDGSGAYVVPSYRFTGEAGEQVLAPAVADEALRPPGD